MPSDSAQILVRQVLKTSRWDGSCYTRNAWSARPETAIGPRAEGRGSGQSGPMSDLFVFQTPLAEFVLYFFLLLVMRFIGRREFGQFSPFDLTFLLLISESAADALTAGRVSASILLLLPVLVSIGQYKNPWIRNIFTPASLKVIEDSKNIGKSPRRENDLIERFRLRGIAGVEEVRVAYIESDGDLSALTYGYQTAVIERERRYPAVSGEIIRMWGR